jgi:RNA polymerase sigma-70 factor (ECF subfamily)
LTEFEAFFADEYGAVLRTVALAIGDRARAEDATQEAFARAYRRWRSVSRHARPAAWVHVVALNVERSRLRRDRRARPAAEVSELAPARDPADGVTAAVVVERLLATLPPRQRAAVVLRYLGELTVPEIADALRCSEGTVKSNLHDARRALRAALDRSDA